MRNLHLFLSSIEHETRLFKEARATLDLGIFNDVWVLGLQAADRPDDEIHESGLRIRRLRTASTRQALSGRAGSRIRRILNAGGSLMQYAVSSIQEARRGKPSHITCHNPILLPIAFLAARTCGAKVVYAPHELEAERTGLQGLYRKFSAAAERHFAPRCASVVVVCAPIADWYRGSYGLNEVHVVRAIPEGRAVAARDLTARAHIRSAHSVPQDALLFIYQGLLEPIRGIDTLIDAFLGLDEPYHLMFMGYGSSEPAIRDAMLKSPRIHFQPSVPVDEIVRYSAAADVGVFVLANPISRSYALSLPNKFFEYLFAGLPVVVSDNLELLSALVSEHRLGWVVSPSNLATVVRSCTPAAIGGFISSVDTFAAENSWLNERQLFRAVYQ